MAKVLSESARYVTAQSAKNYRQRLVTAFVGGLVTAFLAGIFIGWDVAGPKRSIGIGLVVFGIAILAMLFAYRVTTRKADEFEKSRISFLKGATGEVVVAEIIAGFPDDFCVINDLATPFGNLDHVVVGPTGVFLIETKNWKGLIEADRKGDVLLNRKPPEKPLVKHHIARVMNVRDKVATLCDFSRDKQDLPFFKAAIAFPSARVEARWGDTGSADCVAADQLETYIVKNWRGKILEAAQVQKLANAFLALAKMDKDFPNGVNPNADAAIAKKS